MHSIYMALLYLYTYFKITQYINIMQIEKKHSIFVEDRLERFEKENIYAAVKIYHFITCDLLPVKVLNWKIFKVTWMK